MINLIGINSVTVFNKAIFNFCTGINVVIGENGTGKTQLLKLLYASTTDGIVNIDKVFENITLKKMVTTFDFIYHEEVDSLINECDFIIEVNKYPLGQSTFIPAKEMLSHSKGLLVMSEKYSRDMPFDKTLLDILKKAQAWKPDIIPELAQSIVPRLEQVIGGTVFMKDDNSFWVRKFDGLEIPFSMEAEGLRKFGLLWQLLMNESITSDTVLLWDEPEANLNPQLFSVLVDILFDLSRSGVQIFLATHSYDLAKFIDVKKRSGDSVLFQSLYKTCDGVKCETADSYQKLENNAIEQGATELYNAVVAQDIEDLSNRGDVE